MGEIERLGTDRIEEIYVGPKRVVTENIATPSAAPGSIRNSASGNAVTTSPVFSSTSRRTLRGLAWSSTAREGVLGLGQGWGARFSVRNQFLRATVLGMKQTGRRHPSMCNVHCWGGP